MTDARKIIARALSADGRRPSFNDICHTDAILAALTAAGFRIVGPGEDQTPERHVLASLTLAHVDFLERVRDGEPLPIASRQADRVRQFCRRNGLAEMASKPRRWVLTSAGEAALRALKEKQG